MRVEKEIWPELVVPGYFGLTNLPFPAHGKVAETPSTLQVQFLRLFYPSFSSLVDIFSYTVQSHILFGFASTAPNYSAIYTHQFSSLADIFLYIEQNRLIQTCNISYDIFDTGSTSRLLKSPVMPACYLIEILAKQAWLRGSTSG